MSRFLRDWNIRRQSSAVAAFLLSVLLSLFPTNQIALNFGQTLLASLAHVEFVEDSSNGDDDEESEANSVTKVMHHCRGSARRHHPNPRVAFNRRLEGVQRLPGRTLRLPPPRTLVSEYDCHNGTGSPLLC
jgi:hypothetical protein